MGLEITEKHIGKHIISKAIVKHNDRRYIISFILMKS